MIEHSIETIQEMENPLDALLAIEGLLGYGEGKSSCIHIVDTPMKKTLEFERNKLLTKINSKLNNLRAIKSYVSILQNGDPENENPKKILDIIDEICYKNTDELIGVN